MNALRAKFGRPPETGAATVCQLVNEWTGPCTFKRGDNCQILPDCITQDWTRRQALARRVLQLAYSLSLLGAVILLALAR